MASAKTIKSAIESMMFVWGDPLDIKAVADIFNIDRNEVYACCKELQAEYEAEWPRHSHKRSQQELSVRYPQGKHRLYRTSLHAGETQEAFPVGP